MQMKSFIVLLVINFIQSCIGSSIIMANYYNVILFFPKELGGNDDIRVIFDVRNVTTGTVIFYNKFNL